MICPWFLRVTFFLGVNPYSQILPLGVHKLCGLLVVLVSVVVTAEIIFFVVASGFSSVATFALIFRTFITCCFVVEGLYDSNATITFYEDILNQIDSSSRKKLYNAEDLWSLVLSILAIHDCRMVRGDDLVRFTIYTSACAINSLIPLLTMVQFSLCCAVVRASYLSLQNDLLLSLPRMSSFTLRHIRVRQLDLAYRVRKISNTFGLRLLLYILLIQLILLEKLDYHVNQVASKVCIDDCATVFISFCGFFVNLWYFSYRPFQASCEHQQALTTLMAIETREMDLDALHDMTLLAEDLISRETQFSAAGCFAVGIHIFYSVIGILFSYIMIIGPLAYNKNRALWLTDG